MITSLSPRPNNHHRFNSNFLSPNTAAPLLHYGPGSSAEQTIVSHQPGPNPKPLVTRDGVQYPVNPENGYTSKWPATFRGCLGCGHSGHHFNSCPQRSDKNVRSIYWQELWCHIPSSRKGDAGERRDREKRLNSLLHATPSIHHIAPQKELVALGRVRESILRHGWINNDNSKQVPHHVHLEVMRGSRTLLNETHGSFRC